MGITRIFFSKMTFHKKTQLKILRKNSHTPYSSKILTQYGQSSHKQLGLTFWLIAYGRFDCVLCIINVIFLQKCWATIPYLHTDKFFSKTLPPPLWKFQLSLLNFFKCFGLREPPTPQEIPIPSVEGEWIFSETAH